MGKIPNLDNRDYGQLLKEVKELAGQYTPEWNFDEKSSDFGVIFSKIFCKMMENTISKYNKTSYNHYLRFLNILGTHLRSSAPASGMIISKVAEDMNSKYLDKGTKLYVSSDNADGSVVYETTDPVTVLDTSIKSICITEKKSDFISYVYNVNNPESAKFTPFRIFDNVLNKNLQSHIVYFRDDMIFYMSKTCLEFKFFDRLSEKRNNSLADVFSDKENVTWEYYDGSNWEKIESVEKIDGAVKVSFDACTQPVSVMGERGRYIRCVFKRIPSENIYLTSIKYKSFSSEISPEVYMLDNLELEKNNFYPFGEQFGMYNMFTFCCNEAFTKKGATIQVDADVQFVKISTDLKMPGKRYKSIMTDTDFADLQPDDIEIQGLIWEYWNGTGWARLEYDESGRDFLKVSKKNQIHRSFKFKCPQDIDKISIGSFEANYIRARISNINNQYDYYANYITPYIHSVTVKYYYEGEGHSLKSFKVENELNKREVKIPDTGEAVVLENNLCEFPSMYICLSKPLDMGIIRAFINIEEGIHRYNATLKWEYLADDNKGGYSWNHIDTIDATDNLSHSETITFVGKKDFKKSKIFGSEGYFLRVLNPNKKYSYTEDIVSRPIINSIDFNAVKVIQKNSREPEYFSIASNEENKVCYLSMPNVSDVEVWVNEYENISTVEQERFLSMPKNLAEPEYDDFGNLEKLWVKWKEVPNLIAYGNMDRVYEIDYPKGEIKFGNGINGKIPPEQYDESIKIKYSICNGEEGNIESGEIEGFMDSYREIVSVTNPYPIMGGVNMETVDSAASRMFSQVAGGNRLVSLTDFEDAIKFNDRNIYSVKCVAHVDEDSKPAVGITSIAILPKKFMQGFEKFQGIKNHIWKFIDEKAPATLSNSVRLRVFEVNYVETSVSVDVVVDDFNAYQGVYSGIEKKLEEFLNPVTGNFSRKGWNIGDFPQKEFIYNYIKSVPNIKWIKSLNIFTKLITPEGKKEVDCEYIKNNNFVVPVFGTPTINITVE